jgi:hypothetical protein
MDSIDDASAHDSAWAICSAYFLEARAMFSNSELRKLFRMDVYRREATIVVSLSSSFLDEKMTGRLCQQPP